MYNSGPAGGRGKLYDMRNLPYYNSYYGYPPMEPEYQKSRPTNLNSRALNKRFRKVTIQLNDNKVLLISVQAPKSKQPCLVFSQCEGSYENRTDTVSIPETLVVPFVQQLHRLSKWRPSLSGNTPIGQRLTAADTVFRTQIVNVSNADTPIEQRIYAIKIYAETKAKDPSERKELSRVLIPLETSHLIKVKEALNDVLVAAVESPLYFTKSMLGADGSKFYLDLIKDNKAHYMKISQVTRDFRSIIHLPADDLDALKTHLDSCLKAMKGAEEQNAKKKRNRHQKKRQRRPERKNSQSSDQDAKQNANDDDHMKASQDDKLDNTEEKKVEKEVNDKEKEVKEEHVASAEVKAEANPKDEEGEKEKLEEQQKKDHGQEEQKEASPEQSEKVGESASEKQEE